MIAGGIASVCLAGLLIIMLRAVRALWEDQHREQARASFSKGRWLAMIALLAVFAGALSYFALRAINASPSSEHPPLLVDAQCSGGVWSFTARGRTQAAQRDLRLRGGRQVHMRLQAGDKPTEFFVPGLGLKRRLAAGEKSELRFRPTSPVNSDEAALYRSVCLHHCRGEDAVRPFLVVVEAPRGILAY
jgi:heme/copper-type cytochrome/quinol oxidase subunit 2